MTPVLIHKIGYIFCFLIQSIEHIYPQHQ